MIIVNPIAPSHAIIVKRAKIEKWDIRVVLTVKVKSSVIARDRNSILIKMVRVCFWVEISDFRPVKNIKMIVVIYN
jgi:hypothetical protein